MSLLSKLLEYSPIRRFNAVEALCHEYFDELRDFKTLQKITSSGMMIPDIFNFSKEECEKQYFDKLVPSWYK